jgi:hypothetical protein
MLDQHWYFCRQYMLSFLNRPPVELSLLLPGVSLDAVDLIRRQAEVCMYSSWLNPTVWRSQAAGLRPRPPAQRHRGPVAPLHRAHEL